VFECADEPNIAHAQIVGLRAMMIRPAKLQFPVEKWSQLQPLVAEPGKLA